MYRTQQKLPYLVVFYHLTFPGYMDSYDMAQCLFNKYLREIGVYIKYHPNSSASH